MLKLYNAKARKSIYLDATPLDNNPVELENLDKDNKPFLKTIHLLMNDEKAKCDKLLTVYGASRFCITELNENHNLDKLF